MSTVSIVFDIKFHFTIEKVFIYYNFYFQNWLKTQEQHKQDYSSPQTAYFTFCYLVTLNSSTI